MNLYILVEGRRTEAKLYPAWLAHLIPELERVASPDEVKTRNYFLISGGGYPSIIHHHIPNSIADINSVGNFQHFVVCLDADEVSVAYRVDEIEAYLKTENLSLDPTELTIIVQNRCLETWFLGNRRIYVRHPQNPELIKYHHYYDVSRDDPELMGKYEFERHAHFHLAYLKAIFTERTLSYTKRRPGHVLEQSYLDQLIARTTDAPKHLASFQTFIDFCQMIRTTLTQ